MQTLLQLDPPLPLETPLGAGLAHFVIDYGPEANLLWVVFLDSTGQIWAFPNPQVRAAKNISMGRHKPEKPAQLELPL